MTFTMNAPVKNAGAETSTAQTAGAETKYGRGRDEGILTATMTIKIPTAAAETKDSDEGL